MGPHNESEIAMERFYYKGLPIGQSGNVAPLSNSSSCLIVKAYPIVVFDNRNAKDQQNFHTGLSLSGVLLI